MRLFVNVGIVLCGMVVFVVVGVEQSSGYGGLLFTAKCALRHFFSG